MSALAAIDQPFLRAQPSHGSRFDDSWSESDMTPCSEESGVAHHDSLVRADSCKLIRGICLPNMCQSCTYAPQHTLSDVQVLPSSLSSSTVCSGNTECAQPVRNVAEVSRLDPTILSVTCTCDVCENCTSELHMLANTAELLGKLL
jgi:hypothetical protein